MILRFAEKDDLKLLKEIDPNISEEEIVKNKYSYVLEEDKEILGVVVAFSKDMLKKLRKDQLGQHVAKKYLGDFFYFDRVVMSKKGKGMEKVLLMSFFDDVGEEIIMATVQHKPEKEHDKLILLEFFDFKLQEEFKQDEHTFGVYERYV
ncbi:MAG: hypothetical protein KJ896_02355 [Nanoarchaeota archaeon]|nr:hypothetical protein [Nanoarchaeota archaeon]